MDWGQQSGQNSPTLQWSGAPPSPIYDIEDARLEGEGGYQTYLVHQCWTDAVYWVYYQEEEVGSGNDGGGQWPDWEGSPYPSIHFNWLMGSDGRKDEEDKRKVMPTLEVIDIDMHDDEGGVVSDESLEASCGGHDS